MSLPFDSFVIFAEMRTGSNLLEATINRIEGVTCHGEVFNPVHLGHPKTKQVLGVTLKERLENPSSLLARIREAPGLNGFRFFHDHEPRIFDEVLADRRCAKVILTRNPVESYISLKIAYNTNRWRLTDIRDRRDFKPPFKPAEFEMFLAELQAFQLRLMRELQKSGQTAFYIDYDDLLDLDVLNGLAAYLGHAGEIDAVSGDLVKQNPEEMEAKVRNFPEMEAALARIDWANLSRTPGFEPRRGPAVPGYVAAAGADLLYMPIRSGIEDRVRAWLSGIGSGGLTEEFNRNLLRKWKRSRPGHRSFTVLRHPLARAQAAFAGTILNGKYGEIRELLRWGYDVVMPPVEEVGAMDSAAYREALLAFLKFLKVNVNGQTPIRVDPVWASQRAVIDGFGQFSPPDMICREDRLEEELGFLAEAVGVAPAPVPPADEPWAPVTLAEIYDGELEAAARDAYAQDFVLFGFGKWSPPD
ncbi:nodulation protein NodH [Ostreiculturibacter nitratireducens]|uniref:nodulation protein NodH n=1 Tax=Ostreiculturibacter nitratireducens TaxID=3075226 RepID=UPI0031B5F755